MPRLLIVLGMMLATCGWAQLAIHRVIPSKILYRTQEQGTIEIVAANDGDTPATATLRLTLRWAMDGERQIDIRDVSLAAGETQTVRVPWTTGDERFGREIRAELLQDGKVVASRGEFFNVVNEWWRVSMIGIGDGGLPGNLTPENKDHVLRRRVFEHYHLPFVPYKHAQPPPEEIGPFLGYQNHKMHFAEMPSVFGKLVPEGIPEDATWYSGAGRFPISTKALKEDLAYRQKWGAKASLYSIDSLAGPVGFEIGRQHPEWIARTATGAFQEHSYHTLSPFELTKPLTTRMTGWYGLLPDLYNQKTLDFGIDGLLESMREFGWEGVFWDGSGYVVKPTYSYKGDAMPNGQDPQAISQANIRHTNERIWQEFPNAFLWYNGSHPTTGGSFYPSGNGGGPKAKQQMLADARGGGLMEMQAPQITDPRWFAHAWHSLFDLFLDYRDAVRLREYDQPLKGDNLHTGFIHPRSRFETSKEEYAKAREDWVWSNHLISMIAAAQLHFCGSGSGFRPMLQFQTRYSGYFWDEELAIVRKAYKRFELDSLRDVWWEKTVYERQTPNGRELVFNLVNSPDVETATYANHDDPRLADDMELTLLGLDSIEGIKAWAARPYAYESETMEPVQVDLKPELIDGDVVLVVPPFRYYMLVVVQLPGEDD